MSSNSPIAPPASTQRWPGWPGDNVFRLVVPVVKVGSIIGRGGELVKKLCNETRARVRVLDGPLGTADCVVLISGKEEPEVQVSPAMEAVVRIFRRLNDIPSDGKTTNELHTCSFRLLMPSAQAIHLIGRQGSTLKTIQGESGAVIKVLAGDERTFYASPEERLVDIYGEPLKVLKALEAVVAHLRKFLVDHSVIPLFEQNLNELASQDHGMGAWSDQTWVHDDYPPSLRSDFSILDRGRQRESRVFYDELLPYEHDPALSRSRYPGLVHPCSSMVTQITQPMHIPMRYEEAVIGSGGGNLAYVHGRSGATVSILDAGRLGNIVLQIMGTPTQVQAAQQVIEECIARHDGFSTRSGPVFPRLRDTAYLSPHHTAQYGGYNSRDDPGFSLFSPFHVTENLAGYDSRLTDAAFLSSSLTMETYGRYGSPGLGGYHNYC